MLLLVDVSDFFFFCSGRGKGAVRGAGRGDRFLLNSQYGGGVLQEGEGPRGREGRCLWRIGEFGRGGWLNIFLGAELSTKF